MVTMLAIMKDTDDHFEKVAKELEQLRIQNGGRPSLKIVADPVDKAKQKSILLLYADLDAHPAI